MFYVIFKIIITILMGILHSQSPHFFGVENYKKKKKKYIYCVSQ